MKKNLAMFKSIKTSKANKAIITQLTRKYNLGAENVIARIALAYSLEHDEPMSLDDLQDSGGKEYSRSVLFGTREDIYTGLICTKYKIHSEHPNFSKIIKQHIDKGLFHLNSKDLDGLLF